METLVEYFWFFCNLQNELVTQIGPCRSSVQNHHCNCLRPSLPHIDNSYSKKVGPTMNELLRAVDSRLTASRQELVAAFNHAAGATCSTEKIAYSSTFAQHFGAADISTFFDGMDDDGISEKEAAVPTCEKCA